MQVGDMFSIEMATRFLFVVFMNVNPDAWFPSDLRMDKVDKDLIFSTSHLERLTLHPTMVANVGNLMIFPGISASTVRLM